MLKGSGYPCLVGVWGLGFRGIRFVEDLGLRAILVCLGFGV